MVRAAQVETAASGSNVNFGGFLIAYGGANGTGGTNSAGSAGAGGIGSFSTGTAGGNGGGAGSAGSAATNQTTGASFSSTAYSNTGGGGGGGLAASPAALAGGVGGANAASSPLMTLAGGVAGTPSVPLGGSGQEWFRHRSGIRRRWGSESNRNRHWRRGRPWRECSAVAVAAVVLHHRPQVRRPVLVAVVVRPSASSSLTDASSI